MNEQTRQLARTLETSAESALDTLFVAITQSYMDHPSLREIFNEREANGTVTITDDTQRLRANALAEAILDSIERALVFEERELPGSAANLRAWIHDSFRYSAHLRDWFDRHASWYSPALRAVAADVRHSLDRATAPPTEAPSPVSR